MIRTHKADRANFRQSNPHIERLLPKGWLPKVAKKYNPLREANRLAGKLKLSRSDRYSLRRFVQHATGGRRCRFKAPRTITHRPINATVNVELRVWFTILMI